MRVTVDIPDCTYQELKANAARQGCSMRELILRGVQRELRVATRRRGRIRPPIVHSKKPGTLSLTNQQIYEMIPFP